MRPIVEALLIALDIYWWIVILAVIFSWLYAFNIVNTRNQVVSMIGETVYRLTEPLLAPIRRLLPNTGGMDLSTLVLLLLLYVVRRSMNSTCCPRSTRGRRRPDGGRRGATARPADATGGAG